MEAVRAGVADGTIDCLATDHAPHRPRRRNWSSAWRPSASSAWSAPLGLYVKALIDTGPDGLAGLIARMTVRPAPRDRPRRWARCAVGRGRRRDDHRPGRRWTVDVNQFALQEPQLPLPRLAADRPGRWTIVDGQVKFRG